MTNLDDASLNNNPDESRQNPGEPAKLTFDQYVKKLTNNYTSQSVSETGRLSLKVDPAPSLSNRDKLSTPIINPAIKAALGRYDSSLNKEIKTSTPATIVNGFSNVKTPQLTVNKILNGTSNGSSGSSTVRLMTVGNPVNNNNSISVNNLNTNISSSLNGLNKKILIVNGTVNSVNINGGIGGGGSPSLLKLINVTQMGGSTGAGVSQLSAIKAVNGVTASSINTGNTSKNK